jgi:predicted transcriptional regulator
MQDTIKNNILNILKEGRSFTDKELAVATNTPTNIIDQHLLSLIDKGIVTEERQDDIRQYKLIKLNKEDLLKLNVVDTRINPIVKNHTKGNDFKYCRSCYSHLAGKVGVMITSKLVEQSYIRLSGEHYEITPAGRRFFDSIGIDIIELQNKKKMCAKTCLDWSEQEFHIAGLLGSAIFSQFLKSGWIKKQPGSRVVTFTDKGQVELKRILDLDLKALD